MTSRELIRWSQKHERRARTVPPLVVPLIAGGVVAAWVAWRGEVAGSAAASHAWLAATLVGSAVAFLRVPFHIYWRGDAPLLAQLPIEGAALFDAALLRCVRAGGGLLVTLAIGALPIALDDMAGFARHVAYAGALAAAAALLMPAVAIWAAALVVQGSGARALQTATALATGSPGRALNAATARGPAQPSAILGALPGFAATVVIVVVLLVSPWLTGGRAAAPPGLTLGGIVGVAVFAIAIARRHAGIMALVLRDVSALDRQRLATLEIKPPTGIERAIGRLLGDGALAYSKDARLMRRRYPMAFALGALAFVVLAIVGLARPVDPTPWMSVAIGGSGIYGIALARRLRRPPIELPKLSATLPIASSARIRAKVGWLVGWWVVFVVGPGLFAALRQSEPRGGLVLVAVTTVVMFVAGALAR